MSHQTGITATDDLKAFIGSAKLDDNIRMIKVKIDKEQLVLADSANAAGSWKEDYDKLVIPRLEHNVPCYIFYRTDTKGSQGYEWIFISYSPDNSVVRQKMLYASTKATIRREFGTGLICDELFGTNQEDVCLDGYNKYKVAQNAPPPLTDNELELEEVKQKETRLEISVDTKHQTMKGLHFPMTDRAQKAMEKFKDGHINYVQMRVNIKEEEIDVTIADVCVVGELASRIPSDSARYHLYNYLHMHEGDELTTTVFIYSMPGYVCPIKERMIYSSCLSSLTDAIGENYVQFKHKMEVRDGTEVTEEAIYDEIHPKTNIVREKFAKPKGPAGRGPRRIVKTDN